MTEERSRYLDSISKEERVIRNTIHYYHKGIIGKKRRLTQYLKNGLPCLIEETREEIRDSKFLIKLLKKQLPAPMRECNSYVEGTYFKCICCNFPTHITQPYCERCGQKLR